MFVLVVLAHMLAFAVLASSVVEVHIDPSFVEIVEFVLAEGLDELNYFGLLELMSLEPVVVLDLQC